MRPARVLFLKAQDYRLRRMLQLPAHHVYDVVGDVARYDQFVPNCLRSEVVATDPHTQKPQRAILRVGWRGLDEEFESKVDYLPNQVIARAADTQMFRELHCEWTVKAVRERQCIVALLLRFQFQSSLYNIVSQQAGPLISRRMVEAFSQRAIDLWEPESRKSTI